MDPTNAPQGAAPAAPTPTADLTPAPVPPQPVVAATTPPSKGNGKMIWIIVLVVIIILGLGAAGYYFYTQNMMGQSEVIESNGASLNAEFQQLESEVNDTPIDEVETQFIEVDKEIQNL